MSKTQNSVFKLKALHNVFRDSVFFYLLQRISPTLLARGLCGIFYSFYADAIGTHIKIGNCENKNSRFQSSFRPRWKIYIFVKFSPYDNFFLKIPLKQSKRKSSGPLPDCFLSRRKKVPTRSGLRKFIWIKISFSNLSIPRDLQSFSV